VKAKLLEGKRGLIVGIANDQSIAWGCAQAFRALGSELALFSSRSAFADQPCRDCGRAWAAAEERGAGVAAGERGADVAAGERGADAASGECGAWVAVGRAGGAVGRAEGTTVGTRVGAVIGAVATGIAGAGGLAATGVSIDVSGEVGLGLAAATARGCPSPPSAGPRERQ